MGHPKTLDTSAMAFSEGQVTLQHESTPRHGMIFLMTTLCTLYMVPTWERRFGSYGPYRAYASRNEQQ